MTKEDDLLFANRSHREFDMKEVRYRARLAWNNWPDSEASRREIAAHEARDPISAASWDRVIEAIRVEIERFQGGALHD